MKKLWQVRNLEDSVYQAIKAKQKELGVTIPELFKIVFTGGIDQSNSKAWTINIKPATKERLKDLAVNNNQTIDECLKYLMDRSDNRDAIKAELLIELKEQWEDKYYTKLKKEARADIAKSFKKAVKKVWPEF